MKNKILTTIVALVLLALGFNAEQIKGLLGEQAAPVATTAPSAERPKPVAKSTNKSQAAGKTKPSASLGGKKWSNTSPKVNLHHVFHGEINRKGKPVGFHSRPNGNDPESARVVRIKSKPNRAGVYTATIAVRDGSRWKEKFSSFFPDKMSESEVLKAILGAYKNSRDKTRQPWRGPSGLGFDIQGYTLSRGDINTAFPVYEKN